MEKPMLQLAGEDGNAFAILGKARRVARESGWSQDEIDVMLEEAMSGDYDHLLRTMMRYFDVN